MKGGEINGFIKTLKDNDYQILTSIATGSGFFNSKQAYKSLGIIMPHYLVGSNIKNIGDRDIFDGDLFDYNTNKIRDIIKTSNKPFFNYVVGMYGHTPAARNTNLRPDIIYTTPRVNSLQKLSNQFYYRTEAIAKYLTELSEIDPNSIIYITSDHLPPLYGNNLQYIKEKNINISLLFNCGNYVDVSGKYYFEIPWVIWDILTGKSIDRMLNMKMEDLYYKALIESL